MVAVQVVDGAGRRIEAHRRRAASGGGRGRRRSRHGRLLRARQPHLYAVVGLAAVRKEQGGAGDAHGGRRAGHLEAHSQQDRPGRVDRLVEPEDHVAVGKVDLGAFEHGRRRVVCHRDRGKPERSGGVSGKVVDGAGRHVQR